MSFAEAAYVAAEGGPAVTVTVRLSAAPEREVTVPLLAATAGGTTADDYAGVPAAVTFGADATMQAFSFTAADADDDDGETVTVGFGALPAGVAAGRPAAATVAIADADGPGFTDAFAAGAVVRAVHLIELRLRIDALRDGLGLVAFAWTDPVIEPGVTPVRAVHLAELRRTLGAVYEGAGQGRPGWTDDPVEPDVTAVRAVHFRELRAAVAALE